MTCSVCNSIATAKARRTRERVRAACYRITEGKTREDIKTMSLDDLVDILIQRIEELRK